MDNRAVPASTTEFQTVIFNLFPSAFSSDGKRKVYYKWLFTLAVPCLPLGQVQGDNQEAFCTEQMTPSHLWLSAQALWAEKMLQSAAGSF